MMQFRINVGASNCNPTNYVVTDTYAKEGDVSAYTVCGAKGMTISNIRMRIIEHHPSATSLSDVTSSLRTNLNWYCFRGSFNWLISATECNDIKISYYNK